MYKVLIVDDEVLVRVGLKSTIDWASLGFAVAAEAANGEQAYEAYRLHKPELIITDIRMPKQDGFWLIKKVRQENQHAKILILTCYNDFEYAREALKNGADNYILKSEVEDEELIKIMTGIKESLDMERSEEKRYDFFKKQIDTNLETLKEKLLDDLLKADTVIDEQLLARCNDLDFTAAEAGFVIVTLIRDDAERRTDFSDQEWQHMNNAIRNITSGIIADHKIAYLIKENGNQFILLLAKSHVQAAIIEEVIDSIRCSIAQYFNIPLSGILSRIFDDLKELPGIYLDLCIKAEQLFYAEESRLLYASAQTLNNINIFSIKKDYEQLLIKYMDEEDELNAMELIDQTETFFRQNTAKVIEVKLFYSNMISNIFEWYQHCFDKGDETGDYTFYHQRIMAAVKMNNLIRLVKEVIASVVGNIRKYRLNNSNQIIKKAVDYIENNYDREISTQFLAEYLNLSKHYVCYLFKKETGYNISLYVNKLRIEKAKHLVLDTNYKIKEIYDKLGFSDQQYFCKIFKRITGMTVLQYRDSVLQKHKNCETGGG
jgi:two-component system response regulator YesN